MMYTNMNKCIYAEIKNTSAVSEMMSQLIDMKVLICRVRCASDQEHTNSWGK